MKLHEAFDLEKMKSELPELPEAKRMRLRKYGLKEEHIEAQITADFEMKSFFESVCNSFDKIPDLNELVEKTNIASNYINSDMVDLRKDKSFVFPSTKNYVELVNMIFEKKISSRAAKDILAMIVVNDESPLKIATEKNLLQQNDEGALKEIVQKTIDANPEVVDTYKGGKENAIMSLVGKVIKETSGAANPQLVIKLLKELIV
jgi:aspartyl-tRNA(Asn)/glutamyl-tRNA(Gln) amidotransferase subunit B